jgi:predicted MFS family arabinose efflux permease
MEQNMSVQADHISTLLRYSGISGVAGAVNHGFFSEDRSFITAAIGIVLYLAGALMEHRSSAVENRDWTSFFGFGIVSSIGIGFFTGGIQHFPDSPHRSLWVVPVGFVLSLVALYLSQDRKTINLRPFMIYSILGTVAVVTGCFGALEVIQHMGLAPHEHGH